MHSIRKNESDWSVGVLNQHAEFREILPGLSFDRAVHITSILNGGVGFDEYTQFSVRVTRGGE